MLETFKKLVDATVIAPGSSDASINDQTNELYNNIRATLKVENGAPSIPRVRFFKLINELVYNYVLKNEDPTFYLNIIRVVRDATRIMEDDFFPDLCIEDKWTDVITNAKIYNLLKPKVFQIDTQFLRNDYASQLDMATSAQFLAKYGYNIEIKDSEIVPNDSLLPIVDKIKKGIKEIGGVKLVKEIFSTFYKNGIYSNELQRYLLSREIGQISAGQSPNIPFGYLLNLAVQFPYENKSCKKWKNKYDNIIILAIALCNIYGVQKYSVFANLFHKGQTIVRLCQEIALWDSIFSINQCNPSYAVELNEFLFDVQEFQLKENELGFKISEFHSVTRAILDITRHINCSIHINPQEIYYKLNKEIKQSTILVILNTLSHGSEVNKGLNYPSDYIHVDFQFKPLIKVDDSKYLLMDKSWCFPAFYEALAYRLRDLNVNNFEGIIGLRIEEFLDLKLTQKGISFCRGDYDVDGIHGECDLVIETDDTILLIESKKKVLTRNAKSGIDINLILDLTDSLLSSQLQAGKTEIFLLEKGQIQLVDKNGEIYNLELRDRKIERISMTQLEYGGFQDRTISQQILISLLTHNFGTYSTEPSILKKFGQLKNKQEEWRIQYQKLSQYHTRYKFFNCWFLSLPQLVEVINRSEDSNSMKEILKSIRHLTTGSLDFYKELINGLNMKRIKEAKEVN